MADRTSKSKKLRKRDVLIYLAAIAAVLAVVIIAAQIIERISLHASEIERREDSEKEKPTSQFVPPDDSFLSDDGVPENLRETDPDDISTMMTGKYNNNIKNIVFIGVDKQELSESDYYRSGGQSDVIIVFSMNLKTKEYFMLSINRDLAVPVENYNYDGSSYGVVDEQIALAYAYGDGARPSGRNVIKSLNWLLGSDMKFLGFIAAPIPIVSTLADAVGGVEVTIEDDFSGVDDTLVMGEKVNLTGKHAETFVRARMSMKESNTNSLRMNRQIVFMEAFMKKMKSSMSTDDLINMYSDVIDMVNTDMGRADITKWMLNCYNYTFKGTYRIDGVEGEWLHDARCTYYNVDEVAALVQELYYIEK